MTLIRQKLAMHSSAEPLEVFAIGGTQQFSLIINPVIYNYQILHRQSGLHVTSFDLPESAVDCFKQLEAEVPLFSAALDKRIRKQIQRIIGLCWQKELEAKGYTDDEFESCE